VQPNRCAYARFMSDAALIGPATAPQLHVMSFNIRRRMTHVTQRSPDLWSHRRPALRRLFAVECPTIVGVQEALPDQAAFVKASLTRYHRRIGRGRSAGQRGEGCPIFFDTRRLQLDHFSQLALSDTPDIAGSRSWGNRVPRIAMCADFTDRATGVHFRFINTHLDHQSRRSRLRAAGFIADLATETDNPVLVTGDFNSSIFTGPYDRLVSDGPLVDTWYTAHDRLTESWGSFPNYRAPVAGHKRIDWILTSPSVTVGATAINPFRHEGISPSDHLPVSARVTIANG